MNSLNCFKHILRTANGTMSPIASVWTYEGKKERMI